MELSAYRITADSVEEIEESDDFLEAWQQKNGDFWVDIHSYDTDELEPWLHNLGVSDLAMKCCLEAGQANRLLPLNNEVFLEFPTYAEGIGSEVVQLSFLCMQDLVVTLHAIPLPFFNSVINEVISGQTIKAPTTTDLVVLLLLLESAKTLKISEELKKKVFDLDERMDEDPDSIEADEIRDQKRSVRILDVVTSAQLSSFELVGGLNRPFLDISAHATRFQLAPSNVRAADQNVDRLEKTIADIRQRFDMNQQEKTNHRLSILTILSAIFMPLTFIAGIYGMNFDKMPELHLSFGYPVVLFIMILIAGGMFLWFKIRGWLE